MDFFQYKNEQLYVEDLPVKQLAEEFGTPLYIHSRATLERHWHAFDSALGDHPHLICYAVKANSNIGILNVMAKLGSGFDIVSPVHFWALSESEPVLPFPKIPAVQSPAGAPRVPE